MYVPLGALYVDLVSQETSSTFAGLINRDPEPDSPFVGERGAPRDTPIRLTIVAFGDGEIANSQVYASVNGGAEVLVFDQFALVPFDAAYSSSEFTLSFSPGSSVVDEHIFKLVRATQFNSQDVVTVRVVAELVSSDVLNTSYSFTIEDLTAPVIDDVRTRGLRNVRVLYNEVVEQATGTRGDARLLRLLTNGVEFVGPDRLRTPNGNFTSADLGQYIGSARCANALNNGYFEIITVIDSQNVQLDRLIEPEFAPVDSIITLSPYRFVYTAPTTEVLPGFTPIVVEANAVPADDLAPGTDLARYVDLVLQDDLSPGRTYVLQAAVINDVLGNTGLDLERAFTAETLPTARRRRFELWDLIPQKNKNEDATAELEKYIKCLDEVYQLQRAETDGLLTLTDIDLIPAPLLDILLEHLGNPFQFELTDLEKRRLADVLEKMYQAKGTEKGMEDALLFFLGIPMDVQPFNAVGGFWILGESFLGEDTVLAPGTSFLRFSFQIVSPVALTDEQRFIVGQVATYLKPAHVHFVALLEPSGGAPPSPLTFWELGSSALGESTVLGS